MKMKALIILYLALVLSACGTMPPDSSPQDAAPSDTVQETATITVDDSNSHSAEVTRSPRTVVAISSSIAEIWQLAGGQLAGVTNDAISERKLELPEDITILGTVKDPGTEVILSLEPDLVLLSSEISSHEAIAETLRLSDIPYYAAKVDTLKEYLEVLWDFTQITGDEDSFHRNGEQVGQEVESLLSGVDKSEMAGISALVLRAFSTGVTVKASGHTLCTILDDIGVENIAAREGFPLEELSLEAIVEANPDYIFVVPMGDVDAAKASIAESLLSNPAFEGLSAVKEGRMLTLSKDLYHYKPNNRWGEAYETILEILGTQALTKS